MRVSGEVPEAQWGRPTLSPITESTNGGDVTADKGAIGNGALSGRTHSGRWFSKRYLRSNGGWHKFEAYDLPVDDKQFNRAKVIRFSSFSRPHMRAFWVSTAALFTAFVGWFSFAPLLPEIKKDMGLTTAEVNDSNTIALIASAVTRVFVGPLVDKFGVRRVYTSLLVLCSIPVFCSGLVQSKTDLFILRFFIGGLGGTFVCNQTWVSQMFTKEIVGTANALSAGWGNLGGGPAQLLMVLLWSGLSLQMSSEAAWRLSFIFPAFMLLIAGAVVLCFSDDTPMGNKRELQEHNAIAPKRWSQSEERMDAIRTPATWFLAIYYAASFGSEIMVFNVAASFYTEEFGLSTHTASYVATAFGTTNLVTRAMGGLLSDKLFHFFGQGSTGMRGRILALLLTLPLGGCFLIGFSMIHTSLAASICVLLGFALFIQMGNGCCFSIVPYVCPAATGTVVGCVGAVGSAGGILWSILYRYFNSDPHTAFLILGICMIVFSCSAFFIDITGHSTISRVAKQELPFAILYNQ